MYQLGQRIPNTWLTPIAYTLPIGSYKCECGSTVELLIDAVENFQARSCDDCQRKRRYKRYGPEGYEVDQRIPGTYLTVRGIAPLVLQCNCGNLFCPNRSVLERGLRKSCGECQFRGRSQKCVLCRQVNPQSIIYKNKLVCLDCCKNLHTLSELGVPDE